MTPKHKATMVCRHWTSRPPKIIEPSMDNSCFALAGIVVMRPFFTATLKDSGSGDGSPTGRFEVTVATGSIQTHMLDREAAFAKSLLSLYPMDTVVEYHTSMKLPEHTEDTIANFRPIIVHISSFAFSSKASVKLPPGESLVMQLCLEILQDGFCATKVFVGSCGCARCHIAVYSIGTVGNPRGDRSTKRSPENAGQTWRGLAPLPGGRELVFYPLPRSSPLGLHLPLL